MTGIVRRKLTEDALRNSQTGHADTLWGQISQGGGAGNIKSQICSNCKVSREIPAALAVPMVSNLPGGLVVSVNELERQQYHSIGEQRPKLIITHQRSHPGEVAALQALPPILDLGVGHLDALDHREGGGHDELVLGWSHSVQPEEIIVGVLKDAVSQIELRLVTIVEFVREGLHPLVNSCEY